MSSSSAAAIKPQEPIIQYDGPHPAGRDRRGVLISSLHGTPSVQWKELTTIFHTVWFALNPNWIRFRMPLTLKKPFWKFVEVQLQVAFREAFPGKQVANFRLWENEQGFRHIDIETPYDNVKAVDILAAADLKGWKAGDQLLGKPTCVGLETSALLYPIKLDNIPYEHVADFLSSLPEFFRLFVQPGIELRVVDIWETQGKVTMKRNFVDTDGDETTTWLYAKSLVILVEFTKPLPGTNRIYDVVHRWPGWVLWRDKVVVHLFYPGKFDYCQFCKWYAQDVEGDGEAQRHKFYECTRMV